MRLRTRAGIAFAGLVATVALAGCGSSGGTLLSADAADQLNATLTQASTALGDGNCLVAAQDITNFKTDIAQLGNVNSTLVEILNQSADKISTLAEQSCPTGSAVTRTRTTSTPAQTTTTTATQTTDTVTTATAPASITTVTPPDTGGGTGFTQSSTPDTTPTTPTAPATVPPVPTTPPTGGSGFGGSGNTGAGGDSQGTDAGGGNGQ